MTAVTIATEIKNLQPPIREIVRDVCEVFGVAEGDVYGSCREMTITRVRWASWYACHQLGYSLSKIGQAFNRDHTTILHGVQRIKKMRGEM